MRTILLSAFIGAAATLFGQVDLNDYKPLVSIGELPDIVSISLDQRILDDISRDRSLSGEDEEAFVERNQYGLNSLIYSGDMLFGDPITAYVNEVAKVLLDANPSLNQDYQFYTLRSNVTNALCTDPGVIFVTTGLLSQIENEAQLAAVLAHEMVHKEEEHFEKSFSVEQDVREKSSSRDKYIVKMSSHSKDAEFEADRLAIEIYKNAGYGKNGVLSAFDVLMYSYLPFDEINLDRSYYQTDLIHIPNEYFPEKINDILAEEDYDDSKSTHPNIKKRRDAVWDEVDLLSGWSKKDFLVSEDQFIKVRNIARFESVRNDLLIGSYADALYSIFLLEREFPNNKYLSFSKAQAWNGLVKAKTSGNYFDAVRKPKKVEGESHAMHYMLRKLKKEQLFSVALRMVQDEYLKFPNDSKMKAIRKELLANLAGESKFSLAEHDTINFEAANKRFELSKAEMSDTTKTEEVKEESTSTGSKYDRIKNKRKSTSANYETEEFDSTKFHLFALTDLLDDKEIKKILSDSRREAQAEKEEEEKYDAMSRREQLKNIQKIEDLLVFQPKFILRTKKPNRKHSRVYYESIDEAAELAAKNMGLDISQVELSSDDVSSFNEMGVVENYLFQVFTTENPFPVEYDAVEKFRSSFNQEYGILFIGEYVHSRYKRTYLTGLLINLTTGETVNKVSHSYIGKPKKMLVKGYVYDIISRLGEKKH